MLKQFQTALVTGASHGVGPYIARALAQEGLNVVLAARSQSELEQVAADLCATGVQVLAIPTDVTNPEARRALVSEALRTFGAVDVLVNNAGGDLQREFHRYSAAEVESQIALNLTGPIELTRLLLPGMLQRKRGHIVNVSSMGGRIGFPYTEVYSAAKDGLIAFTRVLRADYRKVGVSSSVLILGSIGGAGVGERTMAEMRLQLSGMNKAFLSPAEAVARAAVKSINGDKTEIVILPGPGRLLRALMDLFPGLGLMLGQMAAPVMKQVADYREQQHARVETSV